MSKKKNKDSEYYHSVHQVVGAAEFFLSDKCSVEINELQRDILRSAIHFDLSDGAIAKCLDGDEKAMQDLIQACANVAAITGHAWMPCEIVRPAMNKKHGGSGGKKSGEARRAMWEDSALRYAQDYCEAAEETVPQETLALAIIDFWRKEKRPPPCKAPRLVKVIRRWEKDGLLRGRKK